MVKRLAVAALAGVVLGAAGLLAAYLIPGNMGDTCFYIGAVLAVVGALAMLKGTPMSGMSSPSGGANLGAEVDFNARVAFNEHNPKKHRSNHVLSLNPIGVCLLIGGIVNLVAALILMLI